MTAVITGIGVVSPFGLGADCLWDHLQASACAVRPVENFDARSFPVRVAAEVPAEVTVAWQEPSGLPSGAWRDRKLRFALEASRQAWRNAGADAACAEKAWLSIAVGLEQALLEDFRTSFDGTRIDWARDSAVRSPQVRTRSPVDLTTSAVKRALGPARTRRDACVGVRGRSVGYLARRLAHSARPDAHRRVRWG